MKKPKAVKIEYLKRRAPVLLRKTKGVKVPSLRRFQPRSR